MRNAPVFGVMRPNDNTRRISGDFTKKRKGGENSKWLMMMTIRIDNFFQR